MGLSEALEAKVASLKNSAVSWGGLSPAERLKHLKLLKRAFEEKVDILEWGRKSAVLQGFDVSHKKGKGTAYLDAITLAFSVRTHLKELVKTYTFMSKNGNVYSPPKPTKRDVRERLGERGGFIVDVTGTRFGSATAMAGVKSELYLSPEVGNPSDGKGGYTTLVNEEASKVCLVLGAGNQTFLAISDTLHKLFVEGQVVLLKHHPLREFSEEFVEAMFSPMIKEGFFQHAVVDSITEVGQIISDERIDTLHMTGGKATHDSIVFGREACLAGRISESSPKVVNKPFTSELGCVTPWIVSSGGAKWSEKEIKSSVASLVGPVVANASCNCLSPKVVVLDSDWPHHDDFLSELKKLLRITYLPPAYYTGTEERYDGFRKAYRGALEDTELQDGTTCVAEEFSCVPSPGQSLGEESKPQLPLMLVHFFVDAENEENGSYDDYAIKNEAFGPVLAVVSIKGGKNDPSAFLPLASKYCNENVFGTLSCSLVVHKSLKGNKAVELAIDELKYGSVCVNSWSAFGFADAKATWGAYPGEKVHNIESGIGTVHNSKLMIGGVEKSVIRAPFKNLLTLPVHTTKGGMMPAGIARKLARYGQKPSIFRAFFG